jgi:four helix bundle protein
MSGTYEDLEVWIHAMNLVESVYRYTSVFPKQEQYGLTNQMRRAAVSIPSNIAEGKGRSSDRELTQYLHHARGSLYELRTQLKIAYRLHYLDDEASKTLDIHSAKVGQMLNGLLRSFKQSQDSSPLRP